MTPSTKRNLAAAGFVVLIGLCVAAFFVGRHAGSRKAALPAAPTPAVSPSSPPASPASPSPSPSPTAPSSTPPSSAAPPSNPIASTSPDTSTITFFPSGSADPAASIGPSIKLPVHTSVPLSTSGEDPSVLLPTSCAIAGGIATASGTFDRNFYAERNVRVGDVVELYVYSGAGPTTPTGTQLADLGTEKTVPVSGTGSWQVSVAMDPQLTQAPAECRVAVQATHAFMGAGDAGG